MSVLYCFLNCGFILCLPTFRFLFPNCMRCCVIPHSTMFPGLTGEKKTCWSYLFFFSFFPVESQSGVKSSQYAVLHTVPICACCFMNYLRTEGAETSLSVCGNMKLNSTAVQKPLWFQLFNKLLLNP